MSFLEPDLPESIKRLVSVANAWGMVQIEPNEVRSRPRKRHKRHKLVDKAARLSDDQLKLLLRMLEDQETMLINVRGESYAVKVGLDDYKIRNVAEDSPEYIVFKDLSACSCPDNKFRERECKHIEAIRRMTR